MFGNKPNLVTASIKKHAENNTHMSFVKTHHVILKPALFDTQDMENGTENLEDVNLTHVLLNLKETVLKVIENKMRKSCIN